MAEARCSILDITMPGISGLDPQQELQRREHSVPIAFHTAHWTKHCARA